MIKIEKNEEDVALKAAHLLIEQFRKTSQKSKRFSLVLSGGSTPKRTFEVLASPEFKNKLDWGMIDVFWGDERCVSLDDQRSNFHMAKETLLSRVPILEKQLYPIICTGEADRAALNYEAVLKNYFDGSPPHFDFVFLGLGTDGHTASLFPNSTALEEKIKWVTFLKNQKDDFARISLTPQILNLSKMIVFLATGSKKKKVLTEILSAPESHKYPAQLIRPESGELIWLVDSAAYLSAAYQ